MQHGEKSRPRDKAAAKVKFLDLYRNEPLTMAGATRRSGIGEANHAGKIDEENSGKKA